MSFFLTPAQIAALDQGIAANVFAADKMAAVYDEVTDLAQAAAEMTACVLGIIYEEGLTPEERAIEISRLASAFATVALVSHRQKSS